MSARNEGTGPVQPVMLSEPGPRELGDQHSFHFEIDGHEFIAVAGKDWRRNRGSARQAPHGRAFPDEVIGRIATENGQYVIFSDHVGPRPTGDTLADILSRRELQVAMLISEGRCDKDIARQLGISGYTVREHIRRIFAKLQVCRRSAIIARILRS